MPELQITCINKPHHQSPHEHITHIGNLREKWRVPREEAVLLIDADPHQFYTLDHKAKKCYVGVVREKNKNPYLRTHADGEWNDNLLAQVECDETCRIGKPGTGGSGLASNEPKGPVDLRGGGRHG
jgi:hypothetical protein